MWFWSGLCFGRKNLLVSIQLIGISDSNSYWLGDDAPCMTFGLRGVIHASVKVSSLTPMGSH